jgi:hypothetical protein
MAQFEEVSFIYFQCGPNRLWPAPCGMGSGHKGQHYWMSANNSSGQLGLQQFVGIICEVTRTIQCSVATARLGQAELS